MPGLVPGIRVLAIGKKDVGGRHKPGHDEKHFVFEQTSAFIPARTQTPARTASNIPATLPD